MLVSSGLHNKLWMSHYNPVPCDHPYTISILYIYIFILIYYILAKYHREAKRVTHILSCKIDIVALDGVTITELNIFIMNFV